MRVEHPMDISNTRAKRKKKRARIHIQTRHNIINLFSSTHMVILLFNNENEKYTLTQQYRSPKMMFCFRIMEFFYIACLVLREKENDVWKCIHWTRNDLNRTQNKTVEYLHYTKQEQGTTHISSKPYTLYTQKWMKYYNIYTYIAME